MKKYTLILAAVGAFCALPVHADTNDVPVNSLLLAQASSMDSGNSNNNTIPPGDGSQGNNSSGNNTNTNASPNSNNYNPPVEYVVPLNPGPQHRTTVNVLGTTGTSKTGANPEGAGR